VLSSSVILNFSKKTAQIFKMKFQSVRFLTIFIDIYSFYSQDYFSDDDKGIAILRCITGMFMYQQVLRSTPNG